MQFWRLNDNCNFIFSLPLWKPLHFSTIMSWRTTYIAPFLSLSPLLFLYDRWWRVNDAIEQLITVYKMATAAVNYIETHTHTKCLRTLNKKSETICPAGEMQTLATTYKCHHTKWNNAARIKVNNYFELNPFHVGYM